MVWKVSGSTKVPVLAVDLVAARGQGGGRDAEDAVKPFLHPVRNGRLPHSTGAERTRRAGWGGIIPGSVRQMPVRSSRPAYNARLSMPKRVAIVVAPMWGNPAC